MQYIIAGGLSAVAVLLCCIELRSRSDVAETAGVARESNEPGLARIVQQQHHERKATPRELNVSPAQDNVETASHRAQRIAQALRSGKSAEKELVFTTLLPELLQLDLLMAARLTEALEPWAWREDAIKCVVREWAASNPFAAAQWVSRLPGAPERDVALEQLCLAVAAQEPAQAVQIAERFGGMNRNSLLIEQLVSLWAASDYDTAAQWVARRPRGDLRNRVYARLAQLRAEEAPAEAAALVVDYIAPGPLQTDAAMAVLHQWIRRDISGAASWVALFPDGDLRRRAEEELAGALRYQEHQPIAEAALP